MSSPTTDIKERLRQLASEAGACACGFAETQALPEEECRRYAEWLAAGCHGTMSYLERYCDIRRDPGLLLEGCRTVMSLAFSYHEEGMPSSQLFAEYALGLDYHEVLRKRLEPLAAAMREAVPGSETRICIDTSPVRERYWAVRAGVGFIGLNHCLIVPGTGSKVFLAEIFWTAEIKADEPCRDSCKGCGLCIKKCPGKALDGTGMLDASRCYSYLTIENRDELPDDMDLSGRKIYGCDVCQNVCPHNRRCGAPVIEEFKPKPDVTGLRLDDVLAMKQDDFSRIFKGSAVKRAKLSGLLRNAKRRQEDGE